MFEQYNIVKKITRIVIFTILAYLILLYVPTNKCNTEDIYNICIALTLIFIIYDFYYPSVQIELEKIK